GDVVLAAADTAAVVCVTRGALARHHLLAEARRHLGYVLRGRREPGLDERIVQAVVDGRTRPAGRGRRMTADLRALYPRDPEDRAVLRPLTRERTPPPYERARLAADALAARVHAARRAERLGSRPRPYAVAVPDSSRSRLRPFRDGRKDGCLPEQETGVDTVERTRPALEAAAAQVAAALQDSRRAREAAHGLRPQPAPPTAPPPAPATAPPPHAQEPGPPTRAGPHHRRSHVSAPEERPDPGEALARARAAREQMAAALTEDQEPDFDELLGWQPLWKRPGNRRRRPRNKAEPRKRLQEAAERRLTTRDSRRPRARRNRIGDAAAPRCPRPVPGAALRHLAVMTMSDIVHWVRPRCSASSGDARHRVDPTGRSPLRCAAA
ncbi:hypothetical protein ACFWFX_17480, partial [Streptomyces roseolus]